MQRNLPQTLSLSEQQWLATQCLSVDRKRSHSNCTPQRPIRKQVGEKFLNTDAVGPSTQYSPNFNLYVTMLNKLRAHRFPQNSLSNGTFDWLQDCFAQRLRMTPSLIAAAATAGATRSTIVRSNTDGTTNSGLRSASDTDSAMAIAAANFIPSVMSVA